MEAYILKDYVNPKMIHKNINKKVYTNNLSKLQYAILQKDYSLIKQITEEISQNSLKKPYILMAIHSKDARIFNLILDKSDIKEFDKEVLWEAVKIDNMNILQQIANNTEKKYFSKDILTLAIGSCNINTVQIIAQKINSNLFDKDIIYAAINTKNLNIFHEIAHSTNPNVFDRQILNKVIADKNPKYISMVLDYISDRSIFEEYKNSIQQAILNDKEIINLAGQILNLESNQSNNREMQELILDMYLEIIKNHYTKGSLPKKFKIRKFEDSILESRYYFSCPTKINFTSLNDKDRFLILPITTQNHVFSAIVKKLNDNKISITFVNLYPYLNEINSLQSNYKEYVYSKESALNVLKAHSYNVRLYYPRKSVDTPQAYKNFKEQSLEHYTINVMSREQKLGNCFIKNIEKGLRFALALQLTQDTSENFHPILLRQTQNNPKKIKVKFLQPLLNTTNKINYISPTLQLKKDLIENLIKRFPQYREPILKKWIYYKSHKEKQVSGKLSMRPNLSQKKISNIYI